MSQVRHLEAFLKAVHTPLGLAIQVPVISVAEDGGETWNSVG